MLLPLRPARFQEYRILELIQALLARPIHDSLEVIAQEFKPAFLSCINDARIGRMDG